MTRDTDETEPKPAGDETGGFLSAAGTGAEAAREPGTRADAPMGGVARFWRFFAAREAARLSKEAGGPPPHSDDPVIARWRFCNMYRDLDRGTVYFAARRGEGLRQTLWRSTAYRLVNRRETFEAADEQGRGGLWLQPETLPKWLTWLCERASSGEPVFTGRHIVRGLPPYEQSMHWLKANLEAVAAAIDGAEPGLESTCATLRGIPGVGPFFAWQVARDLVEAGAVPEDDGWALAGPGARRGAALVIPDESDRPKDGATAARALSVMKAVRDGQDGAATALNLERRALGWHRVPVNLADVEHALCEFARYETLKADRSARAKCGRYA